MTDNVRKILPAQTTVQQLIDRVMAADPGLIALRRAIRTTSSVVGGVFTTYFGLQFFGSNPAITIAMLAGMVSMIPNISVNDSEPKQRFITMLLIPLVAACSVFVSTLLVDNNIIQNIALLIVIFVAYYLRRFGPRFMALGMMGFMTYYFASLVHTKLSQMPMLLVAIVVSICWVLLVNFVILPEKQKQATKRMLNSYYARAALLLDLLYTSLEEDLIDKATKKKLQDWIYQLEECAANIQNELPDADKTKDYQVYGLQPEAVKVFLFDATLSLETIANAVSNVVGNNISEKRNLLATLDVIRDAFRDRNIQGRLDDITHTLDDLDASIKSDKANAWHSASFQPKRVETAGRWLVSDLRNIERFKNLPQDDEDKEKDSDGNAKQDNTEQPQTNLAKIKSKLEPTTIQAIQVTVAASISIVVGLLISSSHPYWTVLTSFVVLSNANTIGKTYSRAFQRTLGTLLGAVIGFGIASLVDKSAIIEIVLIFACIFLGYYLFSFAYGLMIFFITVMLALLYGILLGQIEPSVMIARFIDTLAGAAIALIVSMVILPTRSSDEVKKSTAEFLIDVENYVQWYLDRLKGGRPDDLIDEAFELNAKLKEVRASIEVLRKHSGKRVRTRAEKILATFTAINYYAGHLVIPTVREREFSADLQMQKLLDEMQTGISLNIEALISFLAGTREIHLEDLGDIEDVIESEFKEPNAQPISSKAVSNTVQTQPAKNDTLLLNSLHNIWHINQAVVTLAVSLGAKRQSKKSKEDVAHAA